MTIEKCDRCGDEIKDKTTKYYLQIEEWDHNGWYTDVATTTKRASICLNCYKEILNELYS